MNWKTIYSLAAILTLTLAGSQADAQDNNLRPSDIKVEFCLASDEPYPESTSIELPDGQGTIHLHPNQRIDQGYIDRAAVVCTEQGTPAISILFNDDGAKWVEKTTSDNIGKRIAVLINQEILQAPKIVSPIGRRAMIQGGFSIQQAVQIALALNREERFDAKTNPSITLDGFKSLFNGKDLSGWTNVNTAKDTWSVKDGLLVCKGLPIGVMRSNHQYENFILHIEWRHMNPGGNSGVFVWSEGAVPAGKQLPKGMEVQMLELDWVNQHPRGGNPNHVGYVSGELFGAGGLEAIADNPRGRRSMSKELRCNGAGEWNSYDVVCVDGTVKLSINGVFVNSIRESEVRRGYLCLESEGSEIHFRNIKIMELPSGLIDPSQQANLIAE
jgi:hypothetical protein